MAFNNLAVAYHHSGDEESARKHAREALRLGYPVHREFLKLLGIE